MKVLLLTDGIYPHTVGGMQKHSYYLGKYLARLGVQVEIVIPERVASDRPKTEDVLTAEESHNIAFIEAEFPEAPYFPGHYLYDSYRYSRHIWRMVEARLSSCDFIYAQGYTAWYLLQQRRKDLPPVGVNFHGVEMYQMADGLRSALEKRMLRPAAAFCLRRADVVYSLGGKLTPLLEQVAGKSRVVETPIGIEEKWLDNARFDVSHPRRFVFVGRYERRKGIGLLHRVIQQNLDREFEFEFVGPIPERERINAPSVRYHGTVYEETRIRQILDGCDVLFCPSYSEGMPTVILEAMARGLAVAGTDVGAVSQLVSDRTGWLMKPGREDQLNAVFLDALEMKPDQLEEKKQAARRLISDRYTWEAVARINLEVIRSCTKG